MKHLRIGSLILLAANLLAQERTGQLNGVVTDPAGLAVGGAAVKVRQIDTNFERTQSLRPLMALFSFRCSRPAFTASKPPAMAFDPLPRKASPFASARRPASFCNFP